MPTSEGHAEIIQALLNAGVDANVLSVDTKEPNAPQASALIGDTF
ncbi:hypothetical protein ANO14919_126110 [Xylariales sp. No.14919]|nr:hypothetical protein ANO14919_126110 [Xylariales sp. No.14919]